MSFRLPLIGSKPNRFQMRIHQSQADERWAISGNRAGKTRGAIDDIGLDITGMHIWRPRFATTVHENDIYAEFDFYDEKVREIVPVTKELVSAGDPVWNAAEEFKGRAEAGEMVVWSGAPDYLNVWKPNSFPLFKEMFEAMGLSEGTGPRQYSWHESDRVFRIQMVTTYEGVEYDWRATVYAKSYDAGPSKFQASGLATMHFDEEVPYEIYDEATMRLGKGFQRWILVSLTPVIGMPWIREQIWDPFEMGNLLSTRSVIRGSLFDNLENLPAKDVDGLLEKYPEGSQERELRFYGNFIQRTGLVYPDFDLEKHVIPDFYPWERVEEVNGEIVHLENDNWQANYTLYRAIDVGWRNPTACLFAAVNKEGEIFLYDEYYERDIGLPDHVDNIMAKSGSTVFRWSVIDPATEQPDPVTGDSLSNFMAGRGLLTTPGNNRVVEGIAAVTEKLRINPKTGRAGIYFCRRVANTIREMRTYRWSDQSRMTRGRVDPKETVQKKDDHALDAMRYLVMSYPSHLRARKPPDADAGSRRTGY